MLALDLYRARRASTRSRTRASGCARSPIPTRCATCRPAIDFLALREADAGAPHRRRRGLLHGRHVRAARGLPVPRALRGGAVLRPALAPARHPACAGRLDPRLKPVQPLDAAPDLRCPLLAFFGDQDEFIPLADIEQLRERLAEADAPSRDRDLSGRRPRLHERHARRLFRPEAARDAWAKTLAWLRLHLGT